MDRRDFLRAAGATGAVAAGGIAGCAGLFRKRSIRSPPLVENRPDAVYYPTHVDEMAMIGKKTTGRYAAALTYTYPHRFWLVNGDRRNKVAIESGDSMHLMASLWDRRSETVLVGGSVTVRIERDGETPVDRPPWPMLSQKMGVHFGDNVALPAEGEYTVTLAIGGVDTRLTGALAGAFGDGGELTFDLSYRQSEVGDLGFRRLEKAGERGAVEPMEMNGVPTASVPAPGDLPGTVLGEATTGDGVFVATRLDSPPEGVDASGPYLAVSARSPYNRYPLSMMSLSARVRRSGSTVFDGPLEATLDPDLGYHYGTTVDSLESGDTVTLSPGVPPQIARHEGYETAFFDLSEMTIEATI